VDLERILKEKINFLPPFFAGNAANHEKKIGHLYCHFLILPIDPIVKTYHQIKK
jgi:hypothetical protein